MAAERYRYLDLLRGIALLGILPANIHLFGRSVLEESWTVADQAGAASRIAWLGMTVLVEYKFITLFTVLFGAGLMVQRQRAGEGDTTFGRRQVRRLLALGLFGAAHALLLWYGDIVFHYALYGLCLVWATAWRPRTQLIAGAVLIAIPALLCGCGVAVTAAFPAGGEAGTATAAHALGSWEQYWEGLFSPTEQFEAAIYSEGSIARIFVTRAATWLAAALVIGIAMGGRIAGGFLLGMAAVRAGWTDPAAHRSAFRRCVAWGLGIGLPLELLSAWVLVAGGGNEAMEMTAELLHYCGSLPTAIGYAGLIGLLAARGDRAWRRPLEAIGRTAFTNYLLQSLLCTTFFYAYGFGMFGRLTHAQLWLVVIAVWSIQLVISPLILRRWSRGPVEWAWRRVAGGR